MLEKEEQINSKENSDWKWYRSDIDINKTEAYNKEIKKTNYFWKI